MKLSKVILTICLFCPVFIFTGENESGEIAAYIEISLKTEVLDIWYPRCIDMKYGGYLCDFSYNWEENGSQDKMIVTQARQLWTTSESAMNYKEKKYGQLAANGFKFLNEKMWDPENGGFFERLNRKGKVKNEGSKTAYGNAFAIYGLTSYFKLSRDSSALNLAKKTFLWLEKYSHDSEYKGYYNNLNRNGSLPSAGNRGIITPGTIIHTSADRRIFSFRHVYLTASDRRIITRRIVGRTAANCGK